jgi:protein-tyrosine phosphatase
MNKHVTFYNLNREYDETEKEDFQYLCCDENETIKKYLNNFFIYEKFFNTPILYFKQFINSETKFSYYPFSNLLNFKQIKETYNISIFITSINESNYINIFENKCMSHGIKFKNFFIDNINTMNENQIYLFISEILAFYNTVYKSKESILIHCSSGINKSKIIIYILLRLNGYNNDESRNKLEIIMNIKNKLIGDFSIEFIEKRIQKYLKLDK